MLCTVRCWFGIVCIVNRSNRRKPHYHTAICSNKKIGFDILLLFSYVQLMHTVICLSHCTTRWQTPYKIEIQLLFQRRKVIKTIIRRQLHYVNIRTIQSLYICSTYLRCDGWRGGYGLTTKPHPKFIETIYLDRFLFVILTYATTFTEVNTGKEY